MTSTLLALLRNPYAIFAGWTLAVVLCATTIVGLLFAGWRLLRGASRAGAEYRAGLLALFAAALLAALLPVALAMWGGPTPSPQIVASRVSTAIRTTLMPLAPGAASAVDRLASESASEWPLDALAAIAALAWAIGVLLLTLRLAGGWLLTRSLVRWARPVRDGAVAALAAAAADRAGLRQRFEILESSEIEAPAVLRWRRPVLLVPDAALPRLEPDQITALLIHELAHIRRRDYLVNLLQSIVELPLFFSPAVRWMSRRVREAREFCCDDDAVARCGDRVAYVEALTTLAALRTVDSPHTLGISGPRLVVRVRRLLKEEPMPRFITLRALVLAAGLAALVVTGIQLSAASAARTPRRWAAGAPSQAQPGVPRVPYGYATEQDGSGIKLRRVVIDDDGVFQSATLENVTTEAVAAIRFVVVVERRQNGAPMAVRTFTTNELPIAVAPRATVDIRTPLLTREQIGEVAGEAPGADLQVFYALQAVRFANGYAWTIPPNRDARSVSDIIGTPRPMLPRAFVDRDAAKAPVPGASCKDDRDRSYSLGAVVPVLNEPGRFVRCVDGRWDAR